MSRRRPFARINRPVTEFVARLPFRLEVKLLAAFLGAVTLLIVLGVVGLSVLQASNRRTEALIKTQQRINEYHQLEHSSHMLLIAISSALWMPGKVTDEAGRMIESLQHNVGGMESMAGPPTPQITALHLEYQRFVEVVGRELSLLRKGEIDMAGALQTEQVQPAALKLEQLTDRLVQEATNEMDKAVAGSRDTYQKSRYRLLAFLVVAAIAGIYLAHTISTFVVVPLRRVGDRLGQIAGGQFGGRVEVSNRDEIGALAENVNRTSAQLGVLYADIEVEKERSETMLYHILPRRIVERMRAGETLIADRVGAASILFSDVVGFTELSDRLAPEEVVDVLDVLFSRYDALADRLGVEKIKTIGDGYMVASGVLEPREDHAAVLAEMALGMRAATDIATRALGAIGRPLSVRIGVNSGPLVAGVIGDNKLVYDIWGDTVNTASRMEHYSEPGRINVSGATRRLLGNQFRFESRDPMEVKGKGEMEMFFLERHIGPRPYRNMVRRMAAVSPVG